MYTFKLVASLSSDKNPMATQTTEWVNLDKAQRDFLETSYLNWLASLPAEAAKLGG